jgi:hypothetical protein
VIYTTMIREMRGNQWAKWEIRVSGRVWVHEVKKDVKNDRYHTNQGEKGNLMK